MITFALLALGLNSLIAASLTWNGAGDGTTMNSGANWVGGTAPVANDSLFFDGSTGLAPNNNYAANTAFVGITFNSGAGAFTFSGNTINVGGGVTNSSANLQTIGNTLTIGAARDFVLQADMVLNGSANTSGGRIVKSGPSTLTLGGTTDNSFGTVTVNQGTVVLAKTSTGSVAAIGGDSTVNTNGILVIRGTGGNQVFSGASIILNAGLCQYQATNQVEEVKMLRGTNTLSILENGLANSTNTFRVGGGRNGHAIYGGTIRDGAAAFGVLAFTIQLSGNMMVFTGTNTYSGTTSINNNDGTGTTATRLIVNGVHTGGGLYDVIGRSTTAANQGVLGGSGLISAALMNFGVNTALAPGGSLNSEANTSTYSDTTAILTSVMRR